MRPVNKINAYTEYRSGVTLYHTVAISTMFFPQGKTFNRALVQYKDCWFSI